MSASGGFPEPMDVLPAEDWHVEMDVSTHRHNKTETRLRGVHTAQKQPSIDSLSGLLFGSVGAILVANCYQRNNLSCTIPL